MLVAGHTCALYDGAASVRGSLAALQLWQSFLSLPVQIQRLQVSVTQKKIKDNNHHKWKHQK
jgi:hypothetical protein